jgi:hypothetical protein
MRERAWKTSASEVFGSIPLGPARNEAGQQQQERFV